MWPPRHGRRYPLPVTYGKSDYMRYLFRHGVLKQDNGPVHTFNRVDSHFRIEKTWILRHHHRMHLGTTVNLVFKL